VRTGTTKDAEPSPWLPQTKTLVVSWRNGVEIRRPKRKVSAASRATLAILVRSWRKRGVMIARKFSVVRSICVGSRDGRT
jgi:hypothetical protein